MATLCGSQNVVAEAPFVEVKTKRQEEPVQNPANYVAAIDFGTTSCSLAYSIDGTIENLDINSSKKRVPTAILLRKEAKNECNVERFGSVAQDTAIALSSPAHNGYHYFEFFKMHLHQEDVSRETSIFSLFGGEFYLVEVIAFVLKHLKILLVKDLERLKANINLANVHWVLTVPAIWKQEGKQMMREAAHLACLWSNTNGIATLTPRKANPQPANINEAKLTLALESECTALSCHKEKTAEYTDRCKADQTIKGYLVFDIGGGTIDITALKYVSDTMSLEVVLPQNLGSAECGGKKVNENFSQFLQDVVKDRKFSRFLSRNRSHQVILSKIINTDFEKLKVEFGQDANYPDCVDQTSKPLYLLLERKFVEFYGKNTIRRRIRQLKYPGLSFNVETYTLEMTYAKMADFFETVLKAISVCVVDATKKVDMETIDEVYVSGGFGGCKYVFKHVNTVLFHYCHRERMKLVSFGVPKYYTLAVSRGAVHFCMNPGLISARIMDASYGIGVAEEGRDNDKLVFRPFVHMDDKVTVNQSFTTKLVPLQAQQAEARFGFFCTTNPEVHYITDEDVKKIGEIVLNLESESHGSPKIPCSNRNFEVSMTFGSTEITAKARALDLHEHPVKEASAALDFQ